MKIEITGEPKEIAALVLAVQGGRVKLLLKQRIGLAMLLW